MKCAVATLSAIALASGLALATVPAATAATNARATIRTYVASEVFNLDGFGDARSWYRHSTYHDKVELTPKLAYYYTGVTKGFVAGKPLTTSQTGYLVGKHTYVKSSGARNWTVKAISPKQIRTLTAQYSPYEGLNTFYSIPGVKLIGARHYHVTCTVAQVSAFWQDYLDINTKNSLVADGFKTVTVDLWNDASGRPAKITVTGKSDNTRVYLRVALSHYNQKLTIKAPA